MKYMAGSVWSNKFVEPMNIDFASELQKLAIFLYGRFEFKVVGDKWLHETEEECTKPDNNHSRKDTSASAKAAHMVHFFGRKCSAVFDRERCSQM